jgi:class 3 adenylate cyclase/tetratricopeptide (TPR) repeat protein
MVSTEAPAAEERKVVSVLFCDLVGFTAASDRADPEDVRARIKPYHARLRSEIEGFGGTVEKFIGDAVMAVFGAPTAHEDDPERAVRAGLQILDAIEELNEAEPGLGLAVRIGIETGEAVVALGARPEMGEGIVTGDVVNTASRLQGAAPINGVAVGPGAHQATDEIFEYRALDPVTLKGKTEAVPIFHALQARARFGSDITRRLTSPLVGRDLERTLLSGLFDRTVRDNTVHLVTIVGEPGVGKSRLVAELFQYIDKLTDLVRWRQGRCLPYGEGITFWALGEIVKAEAGILDTDRPETAATKIDFVVPDDHPDARWIRQRLRPLVGLDAVSAAREENFASWRAFLEALADDGPSVFVFEDLHWADDALLSFLEHLADYTQNVPMLLVATARPELFEKAPGFAQAARNSTRVNLTPLTEADTARLVSNMLDQVVLPAEVQSAITSRASGNPLYAEGFVRLLKDRGLLTKAGATWTVDASRELPIPAGVQGLIAARLDTLPADRKALMQDAAVIGKVFWSGAIAEMGGRDRAAVSEALHELSRKELVRPARRSTMEGETEYAFSHSLMRDVCYGQIPRSQRAERHRRAAEWIEAVAGDRAEDHAEIIAAHYVTGLELADAAKDPAAADLRAKAIRFLRLAGEKAEGIDLVAAERNYAAALDLYADDDPGAADLAMVHGGTLYQLSRFDESIADYERAVDGFRSQGREAAMGHALAQRAVGFHRRNDPRHRDAMREAITILDPLPPSRDQVYGLSAVVGDLFISGMNAETVELSDRVLRLARDLGMPENVRALGFGGGARFTLGDPAGLDQQRYALEQGLEQGLGRETALVYANLAESSPIIDGLRPALDLVAEGRAFSERRGIKNLVSSAEANAIDLLIDLGEYDQAAASADAFAHELESAGDEWVLVQVRAAQILLRARKGMPYDREAADWAVGFAQRLGEPQTSAGVNVDIAEALLGQGEGPTARALLEELLPMGGVRGTTIYLLNATSAVRTALATGAPGLAVGLTEGIAPIFPLHQHVLTATGAALAEHRGEIDAAIDGYRDAAARWEAYEMPWEEAHALLGLGRSLIASGRTTEASEPLNATRKIFTRLGAKPSIGETDRLLTQAMAQTS